MTLRGLHWNHQVVVRHSSLTPAGFVLRVEFGTNASAVWSMQVGTGGCTGMDCKTKVVRKGTLAWPIGSWMRLKLAAHRLGTGKTRLQWSANPAGGLGKPLLSTSIDVDTLDEARGSIAIGSGFTHPVSQWDNLTVSPS